VLVFLNLDCVSAVPLLEVDPPGEMGVKCLEAVLLAWPQLRLVVASEARYWMTLEQMRALFSTRCRHRVMATTLFYGALSQQRARTREAEILDWLRHAGVPQADWLALDNRQDHFPTQSGRLVQCKRVDVDAVVALHARLLSSASLGEAVLTMAGGPFTAPALARLPRATEALARPRPLTVVPDRLPAVAAGAPC
jgi:hypothetical protein